MGLSSSQRNMVGNQGSMMPSGSARGGASRSPMRRGQKPFGYKQPNQQHSMSQQKLSLTNSNTTQQPSSFISQVS